MIGETLNADFPVPFPHSYWVIPGLFLAGEYPGAITQGAAHKKIESLYNVGIRHVINLMELDETDHAGKPFHSYEQILEDIAKKQRGSISFARYPIKDLHIPAPNQMLHILDDIDYAIEQQKPVYVHCWGGIGRTGTVVCCFLIRHELATNNNVLEVIRGLRKNDSKIYRASPETSAQVEFVTAWRNKESGKPTKLNRHLGCMIGGAVGDALGAPVEFMSLSQIRKTYGEKGIRDYDKAYGLIGAITDDTQMAMFTAEGLLRAWTRGNVKGICHPPSIVHHAYLQWFKTQKNRSPEADGQTVFGFLGKMPELYRRRAPGNSCLSALQSPEMGTIEKPVNNSKGCGGVMRVAPVGLMVDNPEKAFQLGCEVAAITHGHPTGYLASGALSTMICLIKQGVELPTAISDTVKILERYQNHQETVKAIAQAIDLVAKGKPQAETIEQIGGGWIAEEALAISLYCALCSENDFKKGVLLAVNHSGDSDSTGAITGNILGCLLGNASIPEKWVDAVELKEVIQELAVDLFVKYRSDSYWWKKYPG